MNLAIVLVNYNGMDDTVECVQSLLGLRSENVNVSIVIVDNASIDEQALQLASQFPTLDVLYSDKNSGWSGGNNIGICWALGLPLPEGVSNAGHSKGTGLSVPADAVLLLNNDTVVNPDLAECLADALLDGWDVVGPVINDYDRRGNVQTEATRFNQPIDEAFFEPVHVDLDSGSIVPTDIVNGCAVAIKSQVFHRVGLIDDRFFLICEESDFCLRAQTEGFSLGIIPRALVFHKHSVSFGRAGKPLQRYYGMRNLWLLLMRHAGVNGRRGKTQTAIRYLRYVYHIYCHERELGNLPGAAAVAQGLTDALAGRFGARAIAPTICSRLVDQLFSVVHRSRVAGVLRKVSAREEVTK
ncbi:glycosyltransferase family 2 protein [Roseiconus lacunae]|uniref:glycosyltransferase family 2 protein n=1 Tax=Roseiconus lacunae TaxID=2605694 RepID=UPI00135C295A|nr:glycosyltransferase family 2 protein [Roseiconus lacunae]